MRQRVRGVLGGTAQVLGNRGKDHVQPPRGLASRLGMVAIDPQDRGEKRAAYCPMRGRAEAADHPCQPMHRTKPRIGQGQPARQADPRQRVARVLILTLPQPLEGHQPRANRRGRNRIRVGRGLHRHEGFNHLRHRIQTRGECNGPRLAIGQGRIHNRQPR